MAAINVNERRAQATEKNERAYLRPNLDYVKNGSQSSCFLVLSLLPLSLDFRFHPFCRSKRRPLNGLTSEWFKPNVRYKVR